MSNEKSTPMSFNATEYEKMYQSGYGHEYPESHIIRVHKQILEWELGIKSGNVFDFGCGAGANLRFFRDHGFIPYGCDTSATAIERCRQSMPEYSSHFFVSPVHPDLIGSLSDVVLDVFLSNQVFYFLENRAIKNIVRQAYEEVREGGVCIATMMSRSCWYSKYVCGQSGDFDVVRLDTPRQKCEVLINFKSKDDLVELFHPFRALHIGSYSSHIRQEEGPTDHLLFVGVR